MHALAVVLAAILFCPAAVPGTKTRVIITK